MAFRQSPGRATLVMIGLSLLSYIYGYTKYSSSGVTAAYFEGENFEHLIETSTPKNIYIDSNGKPSPKMPADHFSIRYSGYLLSAESEQIMIEVISDDGVRLWINDILIVNDWTPHALKYYANTIYLNKGKNKLQLEYFDRTGEAKLNLRWKRPSDRSFNRIPTRALRYE